MTKKQTRPSWENYWFLIAMMYSTRGTCDRLRVATIIVKNNRLVGAGYNGSPAGTPHCDDVGHLIIDNHCERTLHSEENALTNTERQNLIGATAYITATPCIRCAKLLVNAGIKEIKYLGEYSNSRGKEYNKTLSKQSGVKFTHFKADPQKLIQSAVSRLEGPGGILLSK